MNKWQPKQQAIRKSQMTLPKNLHNKYRLLSKTMRLSSDSIDIVAI